MAQGMNSGEYDLGAEVRIKLVLLGAASVTVGDCLVYEDDGISAIQCAAVTDRPCGCALQAGGDGDYVQMQTYGPNLVAILTDGSVTNTEMLTASATSGAWQSVATLVSETASGYATADDGGTSMAIGKVFFDCKD